MQALTNERTNGGKGPLRKDSRTTGLIRASEPASAYRSVSSAQDRRREAGSTIQPHQYSHR
eukprot:148444-Rhodomonas_salina.3